MSLIVAKRDGSNLIIVSDTKLTDESEEFIRQQFDPTEGVLKTIFINNNICISFAGGIEYANDALKLIKEDTTIEKILEILLFCHKITSNQITDFIVCEGASVPKIYAIKNGICESVDSAWIGDIDGFNKYQSYLLGNKDGSILSNGSIINIDPTYPSINFSKISQAMDNVIQDESITTVGGFKNAVVFSKNTFSYQFYIKMYFGVVQFNNISEIRNIGYDNAEKGGYIITYYGGSKDLKHIALYIKQGEFGIVYSQKGDFLSYPKPDLFKMDEANFRNMIANNYNIPLSLVIEYGHMNGYAKLIQDGIELSNKGDYEDAIKAFDKAFSLADIQQRGEVFFHAGITYLNMNMKKEASKCFTLANKTNPMWDQKIKEMLKKHEK